MTTIASPPSSDDAPPPPPAPDGAERRRRRTPFWLKALLAVLAALVLYLSVTFVKVWQVSRQDHARPADAIVVLGAAQYNGRPSPALVARLEHALTLYRSRSAPLLVVTGGRKQGDRFTEATAGYNWLRRRGVPDQAILKEVQGRSTWESLSAVAGVLRHRGMHHVLLVSNPAHGERLDQIASELGLRADVSPAAGSASLSSLLHETGAVSIGRIIGYRRLDHLDR